MQLCEETGEEYTKWDGSTYCNPVEFPSTAPGRISPQIVWETPISGVRTFYTDANKQGKAGHKSEDLSKVVQSPYNSVQKSELYAILLVLMDFSETLNIVTDSQYAERVVLHIETAEFIPDESELTSLFIQLQDIIRNRKHPLYITHIRSHTGLPGPLAQVFSFVYDYETCQLLAAPIYFREDMGIEEPADGVNFHSGKSNNDDNDSKLNSYLVVLPNISRLSLIGVLEHGAKLRLLKLLESGIFAKVCLQHPEELQS
ncbi:hypothetical protein STEG23_010341, partial [Scotinomys teguina]